MGKHFWHTSGVTACWKCLHTEENGLNSLLFWYKGKKYSLLFVFLHTGHRIFKLPSQNSVGGENLFWWNICMWGKTKSVHENQAGPPYCHKKTNKNKTKKLKQWKSESNSIGSLGTFTWPAKAQAQQYLPQDMFRASSTQPGILWSNSLSEYTHVNSAFSNNARQKLQLKALSFSTSPKYPWAQTVGHYEEWSVKGPIDLGGWGEGHVWTHRREGARARERGHVWHVCMYGGWLGSATSLRNPSKTSTHFLCWCWRCSVGLTPRSSSGVCSVQGPNISSGFIKDPKERKCGSCSDFPSARSNPVMPVLKCGMVKLWEICEPVNPQRKTNLPEFTVGRVYWSKAVMIKEVKAGEHTFVHVRGTVSP